MITLLDGSLGQELINRDSEPPGPLWGTDVMIRRPDVLETLHREYFEAGALIATANSYAIHRDRLRRVDMEDRFAELHDLALDCARRARDAHGAGFVAGAAGPLVTSYRPDLIPPADQAAELYAEIAKLHRGKVDLMIAETVASVEHARGAVMGLAEAGVPIWLAVSVDDADGTRLRSGEPVADLGPALQDLTIDAWLLNCSVPEAFAAALPLIPGRPLGAYANGFTHINEAFAAPGTTVDLLDSRTDLDPAAYARFALDWAKAGATILGGCCEIGPAHIRHLRDTLLAEGYELRRDLPMMATA